MSAGYPPRIDRFGDHHTTAAFRTALGAFDLHAFELDGREHAALVHGRPAEQALPLVRLQSSCLTGSTFLAELCDCRQQLHEAMRRIVAAGAGVVVYLDQEGRAHGLVEKVAQLDLIARGADTVDAARSRGKPEDRRDYADAATILDALLGERQPVALLTNNPEKLERARAAGIDVGERVALETTPTDGNREYLRVKKRRMGHLLEQV